MVSSELFASDVLGFEECEDDEEEVVANKAENDLNPLKKIGEAIPEEDN